MTKPMIRIHDLTTNEVIDREMTNAEFAQYEAEQSHQVAVEAAVVDKAQAKADLLAKLGITADEAALLLS